MIAMRGHFAGKAAMDAVIGKKQRIGFRIGEIVDRDQLELVIVAFEDRAGNKPTDPAKSVNCYFCHRYCSFEFDQCGLF